VAGVPGDGEGEADVTTVPPDVLLVRGADPCGDVPTTWPSSPTTASLGAAAAPCVSDACGRWPHPATAVNAARNSATAHPETVHRIRDRRGGVEAGDDMSPANRRALRAA
jgi:hypothetical protein